MMELFKELKENPSEFNELHLAIQDYSSTVSKCEKAPRLSNYHKFYKKTQQNRVSVMKENILAKTQQLIPPGIGTDLNFNMYAYLRDLSLTFQVFVPIIDTLFISNNKSSLIYLRNNRDGWVVHTNSSQAYSKFIRCLSPKGNQSLPICIFKPKAGKKLLFANLGNLMEFFDVNPNPEGMFQKYIYSSSDHLSLHRVHWKSNSWMKGYQIDNLQKIPTPTHADPEFTQINPNGRRKEEEKLDGPPIATPSFETLLSRVHKIIAHKELPRQKSVASGFTEQNDNLDMEYCLLDVEPCSISQATSLKEKIESRCYQPWDSEKEQHLAMTDENSEKFMVTGCDPRHSLVTEVKNVYPEIKSIISEIINILSKKICTKNRKIMEATLDFIKDGKKWVVLSCDKLHFNEDFSNFREIVISESKQIMEYFIPICNNAHKTTGNLSMQIKNIPMSVVEPPIIHQRSMSTKQTITPLKKIIVDKYREPIKNVEYKLNKFIEKVDNITKGTIHKLEKNQSQIIESYEKNYPSFAMGLKLDQLKKKRDAPITANTSFYDIKVQKGENMALIIKEENPGAKTPENILMKSIVKDYNSMMIHVRRVNLKNQKSRLEVYGGDAFWKNAQKLLYTRLMTNDKMKKNFFYMQKEASKKMFTQGFQCLFNSDLSLDFRRNIRAKHKNLKISYEDFKLLGKIFIATLKELKVEDFDLEIIYDNYYSFCSAITGSKKK